MSVNILLVGSQHGDELLGIRLYEYIAYQKPELRLFIEYYCANPLAFATNERFIESDMNRSYSNGNTGYEADQARKLVEKINSGKYNYVLDLHTTTTEVDICFIISRRNSVIDRVINASEIQNIVYMPSHIAQLSLIGATNNAISIEVNNQLSSKQETLEILTKMIEQLVLSEETTKKNRDIYYVDRFIDQDDKLFASQQLINFQLAQDKYPVLYGGDTLKRTYRGFWATKKTIDLI